MSDIAEQDLYPWNDDLALLQALRAIRREQKEELEGSMLGLIDHENADVRDEAMTWLFVMWKDKAHRQRAFDAFASDPESFVRCTAAYGIAATADDTTRASDSNVLVRALADPSQDLDVRGSAYDALLILHRRPKFPSKTRDFDPQKDVDWGWVESVAGG